MMSSTHIYSNGSNPNETRKPITCLATFTIKSKKMIPLHEGGLVNIRNTTHLYFGNLIRMMIFGTRFFAGGMEDGGPGEEETEHVSSVFTILKYLYAFSVIDFFPWLRGKIDFEGHQKIIRTAIQRVRKYQDGLIDERIQLWKDGVRKVKGDVLDVLINHESPKLTESRDQSPDFRINASCD
ncbi:unnamed protein product [Lactuca saligna]|uniref:Cytochrome P450 n=1 Tax=Lactuca saligna TaxID=75948 RepID=A0AA36EJY8_LACSI|nr:unnamed protein product [Lactuca saligna]